MEKIQNALMKYLMPIANKLEQQKHIQAIKDGIIASVPIIIVGSFCTIFLGIANLLGSGPIYDFLNDNIQYIPKIINRFKGLAEADRKSGDLEKTMMHKENRELIQITIDDVEETLKTMNLFFGHSKEDKVNRNNLFMNYQIDKEDIDN